MSAPRVPASMFKVTCAVLGRLSAKSAAARPRRMVFTFIIQDIKKGKCGIAAVALGKYKKKAARTKMLRGFCENTFAVVRGCGGANRVFQEGDI